MSASSINHFDAEGHHAGNSKTVLLDSNSEELTLFERKSLLINNEFNAMGMGKYQWYIWSLCGLGYFLDLLWAQAFGLIATPLQQELGFSSGELGNIFTAFNSGLCAGAFVWGTLVDIIGRRWAFNGTVLISCIFGLCLGAPNTYSAILVLTAFNGFGIGGNIPIDTTICLEFLPQNRRFLLALLSIFQPLGVVVCSGIAYGFIPEYSCDAGLKSCRSSTLAPGEACCSKSDNWGWRYLMFTLGGIALAIFLLRFVLFTFQESPKYLIGRGRDKDAMKVLHDVAKVNGYECRLSMEDFRALEASHARSSDSLNGSGDAMLKDGEPAQSVQPAKPPFLQQVKNEFARIRILFSTSALTRLTILVWVIYAFDYWAFSVAGSFLPTILLRKNSAINVSVSETYRDYVIIYLPGILGVALGSLMVYVPRIGRKWAMVFSAAMMGVSLFLFSTVNTQASNIGFNLMEYFFQSMFNAVLYGWTPEAFPAPVRGTASGVASFWGRLFSIVSPLIAAHLLETSLNGPLYLAGSGAFVCVVAIMFLPSSTLGGQST
ncbi:major facilitator superfamily domain-containing protein [Cadophora sp. MPI-SDFR-AT-0126]|nr:major facilitator superfamily domain-containing protein [Leotiomycetes sp. MPI-SDFR-AT-0126]